MVCFICYYFQPILSTQRQKKIQTYQTTLPSPSTTKQNTAVLIQLTSTRENGRRFVLAQLQKSQDGVTKIMEITHLIDCIRYKTLYTMLTFTVEKLMTNLKTTGG